MSAPDIAQGTEGWFQQRAGRVTASKIVAVMSKGRGSAPSATRRNYMAQLAAERLTGVVAEGFTNAAMQHGTETEPQARAAYEFLEGQPVMEAGFVPHPAIEMTGASPDGFVGDIGLVEIKAPLTATHIATLQGGGIDRAYLLQMAWQLACTEREWVDFVSFDPRLPAAMQMHVQRVKRDSDLIDEIEAAVIAFNTELDAMVADLNGRFADEIAVAA